MKLTDQEIEILKEKAAKGAQLNDLQKTIQNDFNKSITYMDTRFLASDLGIVILTEEEINPKKEEPEEVSLPNGPLAPEVPDLASISKVDVQVDQVTRPGMMVNGHVTWSDGSKSLWSIEESGRLSIDSEVADYQPSQEDVEDFQIQLRSLLGG